MVDLANLLTTPSAKTRLHAQQEILRRGGSGKEVLAIVMDKRIAPRARVAALYTLKQLLGKKSHQTLLKLVGDHPRVAEHALRALADRKTELSGIPQEPFLRALKNQNPRVQVAAAVALGRLGDKSAAKALLAVSNPPTVDPLPGEDPKKKEKNEGVNLHQSPIIEGKSVHLFDLDVSDWKDLYLTLGDGGNGNGSDHGAWFDPVLIKKDGSSVCLTDLKWSKATQGWGKTGVGISATGAKLARNDGKPISTGIGTHSIGTITYQKLPGDWVRFQCTVGLASTDHGGKVRFYVSDSPIKKFAGKGTQAIPEGPHATPNSSSILPHIGRQALVALDAGQACVDAVGTSNQSGALMALRYMHTGDSRCFDQTLRRGESH